MNEKDKKICKAFYKVLDEDAFCGSCEYSEGLYRRLFKALCEVEKHDFEIKIDDEFATVKHCKRCEDMVIINKEKNETKTFKV